MNVRCPEAYVIANKPMRNSAVRISFPYTGSGNLNLTCYCSGVILRTVNDSPDVVYILTAAHSFAYVTGLDGLTYYPNLNDIQIELNYQSIECSSNEFLQSYIYFFANSQNIPDEIRSRIDFVAYGGYDPNCTGAGCVGYEGDYALLQVSDIPEIIKNDMDKAGICHSGWDARGLQDVAPILGAVVQHHPRGDLKKHSFRGDMDNDLRNQDASKDFFYANGTFDQGMFMRGTSGSGLWSNRTGNLIGMAIRAGSSSGQELSCLDPPSVLNTARHEFLRFRTIFERGQLWEWLAAGNQDLRTLDSYCNPVPSCFDVVQNQGESGVDCCISSDGCIVCPPCPTLGIGGSSPGPVVPNWYMSEPVLNKSCLAPGDTAVIYVMGPTNGNVY
jgi:hypothetical protein